MTKPFDSLLQKEMSRKEFLLTMGFGLASVMGFSTAIQMLTGKSIMPGILNPSQAKGSSYGYGASAYGGKNNG